MNLIGNKKNSGYLYFTDFFIVAVVPTLEPIIHSVSLVDAMAEFTVNNNNNNTVILLKTLFI